MPSSTARTRCARDEPRVRPKKAPRAPKSQRGVPSPEKAGTKETPSVVVTLAASSSHSPTVPTRPSSLSHSTHDPALRDDALDAPGDALRRRCARPSGSSPTRNGTLSLARCPVHHVEHRAGAKGDLCARSNAGLPEERRRLIADQGSEGWARPRSALAMPNVSMVFTSSGRAIPSTPSACEHRVVPSIETDVDEPAHARVRVVRDVGRIPRTGATRPTFRCVATASSFAGRPDCSTSHFTLVADWFGASRMPRS